MVANTYSRTFLGGKSDLARSLASGDCGGTYDDAILILSSILSSLAATLWPGKGIDRKRFVELWARYCPVSLHGTRVSVPLLAQRLHAEGAASCVSALAKLRPEAFQDFPSSFDLLVVNGETVDLEVDDVQHACPELPLQKAREFTYPNVFYQEVRSGWVHEYGPTPFASRYPGGKSTEPIVSYLNSVSQPYRKIHFNVEWLATVVESIAEHVYPDWMHHTASPAPPWWIDGA